MFLVLLAVGVVGLVALAVPGLFRHGHAGHARVAHAPQGPHGLRGLRHAAAKGAVKGSGQWVRLIPEPRAIFTLLALLGAFGNLFERFLHFSLWPALGAGLACSVGLELLLVRPLWNFSLRFQGQPASPLAALLAEPAHAVTEFRNGKGLVEVVRDGRLVQLSARLKPDQLAIAVRVGDKLRIEDVDAENERVTVSVT